MNAEEEDASLACPKEGELGTAGESSYVVVDLVIEAVVPAPRWSGVVVDVLLLLLNVALSPSTGEL